MPSWLKDTAVLTTLITACSSILVVIVNKVFEHRENKKKGILDEILENLNSLSAKVRAIDETATDTNGQVASIKDGTKKIQRYRLFHDLKKEIMRGYTTIEIYRELSILFESYKNLGGNGEIEALYEKYKELPIREEDDK
ncbi:hypothetical protein Javan174_0056 [Streptococcus phage Javan174]|uniref:hypothetical protein n=1 Tax=Streptococcus entericus TaxID=155680 RepID=UPI00037C3821|nr:hypothetical protein [Streptococcus entericus]QBX24122.1 hypothetical protein Javan174_0056 [Streptococcus phage Javan174]